MKRIINTVIFTLLLGSTAQLHAHDFAATGKGGQKFFFNIIDMKKKYVEVTYQGSITSSLSSPYANEITVPSKVKHKNIVYRVIAIGKKAFSNATSLKGVVLPSGLISIGDFAFEGCISLEKVIFPGNNVHLGEGIFFRCTNISQVTLGSDWTSVNLKMFRWSRQLTSITIPAKIISLQNLKSLSKLQSIEIDVNNSNFTSTDGILYNKDKSTLLGCPRGYTGEIYIPEGTTSIRWGALIDCLDITTVDLPTSLTTLSFREFSRMRHLTQIIMRNENPILTACSGEQRVFLLTIADNQNIKLIVPKSAQNTYKEAIHSVSGEYTEISANTPQDSSPEFTKIPLIVKSENTVNKRNITGVKNFSKHK